VDLNSTAALATIVLALGTAAGWAGRLIILRRQRVRDAKQQLLAAKLAPLQFELVPIWFEIVLPADLPQVLVVLQAINYLNKELVLDRVNVEYLHLNQGPPLENIETNDIVLRPRRSQQVYCRRKLLDSEIRAFRNCEEHKQYDAAIRVSAKGHAGRKAISFRPASNFVIHGYYQRYG
jgi:hypothetical protein